MEKRDQTEIIHAAEQLYVTRLRAELEPAHNGEFIAIEPLIWERGDDCRPY